MTIYRANANELTKDQLISIINKQTEVMLGDEKEITALKQQLQEREELIKELIDTFDLFDEVPLPFKIVNKMESVVKKAREVLKELEIEL